MTRNKAEKIQSTIPKNGICASCTKKGKLRRICVDAYRIDTESKPVRRRILRRRQFEDEAEVLDEGELEDEPNQVDTEKVSIIVRDNLPTVDLANITQKENKKIEFHSRILAICSLSTSGI